MKKGDFGYSIRIDKMLPKFSVDKGKLSLLLIAVGVLTISTEFG